FRNHFGETPAQIITLTASGSNRQYFRVSSSKHTAIAAFNEDTRENKAFCEFTAAFKKAGLNVPKVLLRSTEYDCYLLKDLGDETLFSYLEKNRKQGFDETVIFIYQQVLKQLLRFQIDAAATLDYSLCYPRASFDRQSMMWDMNYFKYYFLKLANIPFNEQKLEDDFNLFADFLLQAHNEYFMYRDFQSRNIMLHKEKLFFIDYQGGRKGALQYDVASLLYDAKADIPQKARENLLDFYIEELKKKISIDEQKFREYFYGFVLIRIMQAMGAYGFRGYYEKKAHFLKSIPYAVENLKWLINNSELPVKLPALMNVFTGIIGSEKLNAYKAGKTDVLTVQVTSFSYKSGYPADISGNGGGFVFDCRALPNPGRYEELKELTGNDKAVITYLEQKPEIESFFEFTRLVVCQSVENYLSRGFTSLTVSYGCTGGQHRSVYFAERLAKYLKDNYPLEVVLKHNAQITGT
ncbi:MAG: RNase adapter RapZ, partial [Bacteroidales bacterium]|nr:RNase adapter RapZ [Bacteroidales bacterium]